MDSSQTAIVSLAEAFSSSSCLVFVGNGISTTYVDDRGREHCGLPSSDQLLEELSSRDYITKDISLGQALAMKSVMEGRKSMLDFLRDRMDSTLLDPPPAYQEIAKLPLSAVITTGWNTFVETSLRKANIACQVVIRDTDVSFVRSDRLPILKLHGSLEDPESVIATTDDLLKVFHHQPLLANFLRVLCAQKTILFVGYDLGDTDFLQLYLVLKAQLGGLLPVSYAVLPNSSPIDARYWSHRNVHVIKDDTVDFLQRLNSYILFKHISPEMTLKGSSVSWTEDPFLRKILGIGRLPTANQIIDGISRATLHQLETDLPLEDIGQRVKDAVDGLTQHRPRHRALAHLRDEVVPQWLPPNCESRTDAIRTVSDFIRERVHTRKLIGRQGAKTIEAGDSILTYSQSTCVLEVINTYLETCPSTDGIEILIAECRPKSSEPFQDALTIVRQINGFNAPYRLVPDAAIGYLMMAGEISRVLMGSHGIVLLPSGEIRVTNTIGTFAMCLLAMEFSIPVFFFAEERKMHRAKSMDETSPTAYNLYPEEQLLDDQDPALLRTLGGRRVSLDNPGYDEVSSCLVRFHVLTEKRIIQAGPNASRRVVFHNGVNL